MNFSTKWPTGGLTKALVVFDNVRWISPRMRQIFTWKVGEKMHQSAMSKGVEARVNLMVAKLEFSKHNGRTWMLG